VLAKRASERERERERVRESERERAYIEGFARANGSPKTFTGLLHCRSRRLYLRREGKSRGGPRERADNIAYLPHNASLSLSLDKRLLLRPGDEAGRVRLRSPLTLSHFCVPTAGSRETPAPPTLSLSPAPSPPPAPSRPPRPLGRISCGDRR
jgi:hypothetical protein